MEAKKSYRISVNGIVQGVGFRPFVYRLAHQLNLRGWVCNTSGSVDIEIEGDDLSCSLFLQKLSSNSPSMANISKISSIEIPLPGYENFEIRKSVTSEDKYQLTPFYNYFQNRHITTNLLIQIA